MNDKQKNALLGSLGNIKDLINNGKLDDALTVVDSSIDMVQKFPSNGGPDDEETPLPGEGVTGL